MILNHHQTNFAIFLTIFIAYTTTIARAQNLTNTNTTCNRHCGGKTLKYPFGFSEGCEVRLNCTNDQVKVGDFLVQNVTTDSIFINIPAKCNRTIESMEPLFNYNFAPTWNNSFLVQNCTKELGGCVIPASTFMGGGQGEVESCDSTSGNITCFTAQKQSQGFGLVEYENLTGTGCKFLFSAVAIGQSKELSLQFQVVELGWWLQGQCDECSSNATCTTVSVRGNETGFRCQCVDGFEGDGFAKGSGCQRGIEDEDENGDSEAEMLENWGFFFVAIVGFATGFWGFIGTLSFKKSWRHAYFRWVEDVSDKIYIAVAIKVRKLKMQT